RPPDRRPACALATGPCHRRSSGCGGGDPRVRSSGCFGTVPFRLGPRIGPAAAGGAQLQAAILGRGVGWPGGAEDDVVDDAVALGFFGAHEEVALGVALDLLDRLAG